jgi:predicted porin
MFNLGDFSMKKTLVAIAALAAVSAFAQSSVTIYGTLDVGYGKLKNGQFGQNNGISYVTPANGNGIAPTLGKSFLSTSVLGFRGVEDLGGGMAATFNLQTGGLNLSTGATALAFSRESNIGLQGGFGAVKLGRATSTICSSLCGFDVNGISGGSATTVLGINPVNVYNSSRRSNQLEYTTPNMSGFVGRLGLTLKGDNVEDHTAVPATAKSRVVLAANYANGPLAAALAYETKNDTTVAKNAMGLGASYNFGVARVSGTYVRNNSVAALGGGSPLQTATGASGGKGIGLGVAAPLGAATVGLQYARNTEAKTRAVEVFANYSLSKRTTIYSSYTAINGTNAVAAAAATATAVGIGAVPVNPSLLAFGIRHTF